jgi:amino acid transporter
MIQESGGEGPYLKQAFGPMISFCFGWFSCFIGKPCSIAIVLLAFAGYCRSLVVFDSRNEQWIDRLIASAALLFLTTLNIFSGSAGISKKR